MSKSSRPIIHERQRRQLCAVHTINNLLQISQDVDQDSSEMSRCRATKEELDQISDSLTCAEKRLFAPGEGSEGDSNVALSSFDVIFSNHRTPLLGNYSFEVIEKAFERRGVKLRWYERGKEEEPGVDKSDYNVIGFVLNSPVERNVFMRAILPKNRRHWFAVAKIGAVNSSGGGEQWVVIDSMKSDEVQLRSNAEVLGFLHGVERDGGNVFVASWAEKK